ncbi:MAG TPA: hypothetical protein PLD14_01805 [Candidatus Pacearchaeota archaeon]|nr:hypothetical protein [Candidatus Pacearchaeota archaeon]HPR79934.1 hypothetical protein [Candidatus Pacearchaeota archaeon]
MQDEKLENSIMGKIKSGQVKLKSKYIFLAEKLGLGTAFTLSVLLSILFFNLIFFYLKETDNLKYLSFGKFGIFAFLESFPYLLVIVFILLIILSGYLLTRSDVSYKRPFGYLAVGMVVLIMIFGGFLTYTNLGQSIEKQARMGNEPVRTFLKPLTDVRNNGIAGIIFEEGDGYLIIQTPQGLRRVETKNVEDIPEIEKGQFIITVGNGGEFNFTATKIKIVNKEDMPAINRGIDFKFKDFDNKNTKSIPPDLLYFNEVERECIRQCFELNKGPDCFKECH